MPLPLLIPVVIGGLAAYGAKKIYNKIEEKEAEERKKEELLFNQDKNNFIRDDNSLKIFNIPEFDDDFILGFEHVHARVDDYYGVAYPYPCASILYKNKNNNDIEIIMGAYFKEHGFDTALCYCAACNSNINIKSIGMKNQLWYTFHNLAKTLVSQDEDNYIEGKGYSDWINEIDRYMTSFSEPKIFTHGDGEIKNKKNFISFLEGGKSYDYDNRCILEILEYYKKEFSIEVHNPIYYDERIMW